VALSYDPTIDQSHDLTSANTRKEIASVEIFADRSKISQVLRNFISNALKFTPSAGQVTVVRKFIPSTRPVSPDITPTHDAEGGAHEGKHPTLSSIMREVVRSKFNNSAVFVTNADADVNEPEDENGTNGTIRIEIQDTGYGISLVSDTNTQTSSLLLSFSLSAVVICLVSGESTETFQVSDSIRHSCPSRGERLGAWIVQ
jgi:signal transduction histidine kinase